MVRLPKVLCVVVFNSYFVSIQGALYIILLYNLLVEETIAT